MKMPWFFHIVMVFFIAFSWYFLLNFHGAIKKPWKNHEWCALSWLVKHKDFMGFSWPTQILNIDHENPII